MASQILIFCIGAAKGGELQANLKSEYDFVENLVGDLPKECTDRMVSA